MAMHARDYQTKKGVLTNNCSTLHTGAQTNGGMLLQFRPLEVSVADKPHGSVRNGSRWPASNTGSRYDNMVEKSEGGSSPSQGP